MRPPSKPASASAHARSRRRRHSRGPAPCRQPLERSACTTSISCLAADATGEHGQGNAAVCVRSKQQDTHTRMPTCIIPADSRQQSTPASTTRSSSSLHVPPTRSPSSAVAGLHTCCTAVRQTSAAPGRPHPAAHMSHPEARPAHPWSGGSRRQHS